MEIGGVMVKFGWNVRWYFGMTLWVLILVGVVLALCVKCFSWTGFFEPLDLEFICPSLPQDNPEKQLYDLMKDDSKDSNDKQETTYDPHY